MLEFGCKTLHEFDHVSPLSEKMAPHPLIHGMIFQNHLTSRKSAGHPFPLEAPVQPAPVSLPLFFSFQRMKLLGIPTTNSEDVFARSIFSTCRPDEFTSICSCSDCFCSIHFWASINLEVSFSWIFFPVRNGGFSPLPC